MRATILRGGSARRGRLMWRRTDPRTPSDARGSRTFWADPPPRQRSSAASLRNAEHCAELRRSRRRPSRFAEPSAAISSLAALRPVCAPGASRPISATARGLSSSPSPLQYPFTNACTPCSPSGPPGLPARMDHGGMDADRGGGRNRIGCRRAQPVADRLRRRRPDRARLSRCPAVAARCPIYASGARSFPESVERSNPLTKVLDVVLERLT